MKNITIILFLAIGLFNCAESEKEIIDYSLINYEFIEHLFEASGGSQDDPILGINKSVFKYIKEGNSFLLTYKAFSNDIESVYFVGTYKEQSVIIFASKVNEEPIFFLDDLSWIK